MVGAYTLESWKLPASIVDALRHHHTNAFHVGAKLSRTIIAGEALARPAFDEPVFAHEPSASPNEAFRALGLRGASIDSLIARTAEESGLLDGLLGAR
jgi:HD-like signal output (HDOD) protein